MLIYLNINEFLEEILKQINHMPGIGFEQVI